MDPEFIPTSFPRYWHGVTKNHVSVQASFKRFAFDTETICGKVFATGFKDDRGFQMLHGLGLDHFGWLIERILSIPGTGRSSMVGAAHYLIFDLGVLLWPIVNPRNETRDRAPNRSRFSHLATRIEVDVFWGKPCFMCLRRNKRAITIIDTYSFFTMSLANALKMVNASVQKLDKPDKLGYRVIPEAEVRPYLEADCGGVYELLGFIEDLHRKYKTRLCYSLPMMSARVFRHAFLKKDFPQPSAPLVQASMLSYHGGKNSFVAAVGWHRDCWDLDINSAYPEAMRQLPDFEHGSWREGEDLAFVRAHRHGIYRVWGHIKHCTWPCLSTHDFHPAVGLVRGLWTTGYELLEAIDSGELRLDKVVGWGFHESPDAGESAFTRFVDHFYALRMKTTDPGWKYFYKLLLNSLYGKFVQRNEVEDEEGTRSFEAGSCFDPSIASLITGFVRARLHRLEHKYKSLHTATDGFITQRRPDPRDCGSSLGKLKQENYGPVLILRNKLYIHYDGKTRQIAKTGLHGFEGTAAELLKLYKQSKRIYKVKRLCKWAEAWHKGIPPGVEFEKERELRIGDIVNSEEEI